MPEDVKLSDVVKLAKEVDKLLEIGKKDEFFSKSHDVRRLMRRYIYSAFESIVDETGYSILGINIMSVTNTSFPRTEFYLIYEENHLKRLRISIESEVDELKPKATVHPYLADKEIPKEPGKFPTIKVKWPLDLDSLDILKGLIETYEKDTYAKALEYYTQF